MPAEKSGTDNNQKRGEQLPAEPRRNFLKLAVSLSTLVSIAGIGAVIKSITNPAVGTTTLSEFPRVKIAELSDLRVNQPIVFEYPLDNEPNVLVKLGQKADGGIGPEGDIVAFSALCQHLGCVYGFQPAGTSPKCDSSYRSPGPVGYCCCHGSAYDLLHNAKVISGPSPRQQPQVILEIDEQGNIFAKGMGPPTIFGHNTGSSDVKADLEGGNPVG
jgi:arsenite oxidase small subunit